MEDTSASAHAVDPLEEAALEAYVGRVHGEELLVLLRAYLDVRGADHLPRTYQRRLLNSIELPDPEQLAGIRRAVENDDLDTALGIAAEALQYLVQPVIDAYVHTSADRQRVLDTTRAPSFFDTRGSSTMREALAVDALQRVMRLRCSVPCCRPAAAQSIPSPEDFAHKRKSAVWAASHRDGGGVGCYARVFEYAPQAFDTIQVNAWDSVGEPRSHHVSLTTSMAGMPSVEEPLQPVITSSRSGASYWRSSDGRCFMKTIPAKEARLLRSILHEYTAHLRRHPASLLPRFLGLFKVSLGEDGGQGGVCKMYFLVMQNLFHRTAGVLEEYDLKGSTVDRYVGLSSSAAPPGPEHEAGSGAASGSRRVAGKDLDLQRRIQLGPSVRELLLAQLEEDCALLERHDIMDYSLLLGVASAAQVAAIGQRDEHRGAEGGPRGDDDVAEEPTSSQGAPAHAPAFTPAAAPAHSAASPAAVVLASDQGPAGALPLPSPGAHSEDTAPPPSGGEAMSSAARGGGGGQGMGSMLVFDTSTTPTPAVRALMDTLSDACRGVGDVRYVDVDADPQAAVRWQVTCTPTLVVARGGEQVRVVGAASLAASARWLPSLLRRLVAAGSPLTPSNPASAESAPAPAPAPAPTNDEVEAGPGTTGPADESYPSAMADAPRPEPLRDVAVEGDAAADDELFEGQAGAGVAAADALCGVDDLDYCSIFRTDQGGIPARGGDDTKIHGEIFLIGLVDILQQWDFSKRVEYRLKALRRPLQAANISAVDPRLFRTRFLEFVSRIVE